MKKIKITITQELELPDECSIIEAAGSKLIKQGNIYLNPEIEFMQSKIYSKEKMHFEELDENTADFIYGAIISEKKDIGEI